MTVVIQTFFFFRLLYLNKKSWKMCRVNEDARSISWIHSLDSCVGFSWLPNPEFVANEISSHEDKQTTMSYNI